MGLAMVHSITQRHGGTMEIASELGRGTIITIRLPIQSKLVAPVVSSVADRSMPPLHVLVVDDKPALCEVLKTLLTGHGHTVTTAASGVMALMQFRDSQFDVVITDKAMPDMNGDQLAATLQQITPGLPIILMSGFGDLMKATGEMPPHISAILSKPVTDAALCEVLAKVMPLA